MMQAAYIILSWLASLHLKWDALRLECHVEILKGSDFVTFGQISKKDVGTQIETILQACWYFKLITLVFTEERWDANFGAMKEKEERTNRTCTVTVCCLRLQNADRHSKCVTIKIDETLVIIYVLQCIICFFVPFCASSTLQEN